MKLFIRSLLFACMATISVCPLALGAQEQKKKQTKQAPVKKHKAKRHHRHHKERKRSNKGIIKYTVFKEDFLNQ